MVEPEKKRGQSGSGLRVLLAAACVIVVLTGLKLAAELFIPIILGLFLALLSMPILNWLDRRGLPRPLAVLATVLIDLLILGGIVFLASGVVNDFQDKSDDYTKLLRKQAQDFSRTMDSQINRLEEFWADAGATIGGQEGDESEGASVDPEISTNEKPVDPDEVPPVVKIESGQPEEAGDSVFGLDSEITFSKLFELYFDENRVLGFVGQIDIVNRFTSLATTAFFAMIIMIFVLTESGSYTHKVRDVLHVSGPDLRRFQSISQDIQKYLAIKTAVSGATGILAMIACVAFRVDFPLLWGLVAFLLNYVPAIGSIMAGIPPVILALILHGFWPAIGVLACFLVINVAIGNFIEPMLLGERFGISTVIVILSVLVWGYIWGPVGMLLAVPLTMLVKVMLDNSSDFRWISALMGKGMPEAHDEEDGGDVGLQEDVAT
ncbi:MAG: AI-2E family transporter [Verrucomicrobiales bacterium]|nr:AI-2E family transporter [Verrucomicrobiales bacterium]